MSATETESAQIVVYAPTLLDELDAMTATNRSSSCEDEDLPRWLTPDGWCVSMGLPLGITTL